jgi:Predicted dehydrogenases and related proteins
MESTNQEYRRLGVALVGLGEYSTGQLGPALRLTEHCYLAGVVSEDDQKMKKWKDEYNLKQNNLYNYENFDEIKYNPDIDIVYVVLPNSLHAEFVTRAAMAGKHVICEKPLGINVDECQRMIETCKKYKVKLSMGYRLHFEPFNMTMMRLGQNKVMGQVKKIIARDSMEIGEPDQWRLDGALSGGGPLMNNGIYCVQAAQFITGELPISVHAEFLPKKDHKKFAEVEEGIRWTMEFPSGCIAECESSYSKNENLLRAEAENGWFELEPAYEYQGLKGRTSEGDLDLPSINQQAAQMDAFSRCIQNGTQSQVPGEMGLRDVEIMMAIYESARTKQKIGLHLEEFAALPEQ